MRLAFLAVVAAACVPFLASPANAQLLFRRAAPCPTCPNGVCQPQPSGPMFLAVPPAPPTPMPPAAVQACYPAGQTCPCTATNCTCPRAAGTPGPSASFCTVAPSGGWYPGKWVGRLFGR